MIDKLQILYRNFNKGLFGNSLPIIIRFTPNYQLKKRFHFRPQNSIEIGAKCFDTSCVQVLDDLLHTMVHIWNWDRGVVDVTQNQYHRMEFCNGALDVGLFVSCHSTRGWGITASSRRGLGPKIRTPDSDLFLARSKVYQQADLSPADIKRFRSQIQSELNAKPAKQFLFKYVCKCNPPVIARVGKRPDGPKPFKGRCGYCKANFVLEE